MKKNLFNSVLVKKPARSFFDLSHDVKLSCNMAQLVPVMVMDCLPGDSVSIGHQSLVRFAPMVAPVMHRFDTYVHYFFVPNRILWENWENYITNTEVGGILPAHPYFELTPTGTTYTKLCDYLGIPDPNQTMATDFERINALPFAAYQKIYNEYYRDQNLQNEVAVELNDGDNTLALFPDMSTLRKRCWEHDYLTSALPFAQKGDPVDIPLGRVELDPNWPSLPGDPNFKDVTLAAPAGTLSQTGMAQVIDVGGTNPTAYDPAGSLITGATTINDLRLAFRLQEYLERNARSGTRYIEFIKGQFDVNSSDKRLQRPEYICGSKTPITISEVLNTTGTDDLPQGNMAGHGVAFANAKTGKYYCEEHGYIIGIMSIMPKTAYQQGMPKHFTKVNDPLDYAVPTFANIGEQPIENREVMAFCPDGDDTWGYIPRYAEYKFINSRVAGDFRTTLDYWHAGRIFSFASHPPLNAAFIEANPDLRIFAVTDPDVDHLYVHFYNEVKTKRQLPKFGTPTI